MKKTVLVSVCCGFVLGALSTLFLARNASSSFAEELLAEVNASGYLTGLSKWRGGDYKAATCYFAVLKAQLEQRPALRTKEIWSLDFPVFDQAARTFSAAKPVVQTDQIATYQLLALRAEERAGGQVDSSRYLSVAKSLGVAPDISSLRKLADQIGGEAPGSQAPQPAAKAGAASPSP